MVQEQQRSVRPAGNDPFSGMSSPTGGSEPPDSAYALIIAGGSGVRLWPESRAKRPKQFLVRENGSTMLLDTVDRLAGLIAPDHILVATSQSLLPLVRDMLPLLPEENLIGEPVSRNTAPGIGLAAELIARRDPNATLVILPADHFIEPAEVFRDTLRTGLAVVKEDPIRLVLLGIPPTAPSTSYGYIECADPLISPALNSCETPTEAFRVKSFREKPLHADAAEYIKADWFLWNAGIFIVRVQRVRDLLRRLEPEMASRLEKLGLAYGSPEYRSLLATEFPSVRNISFDYAVMEHADSVVVLKSGFVWDDLGSFKALSRRDSAHRRDPSENLCAGPNIVCVDSHHNIVRQVGGGTEGTPDSRLIGLVGVDDLVVVQTDDVTLVCRRERESEIRQLVDQLRTEGKSRFV